MERCPGMDIYFPAAREAELHAEMVRRATDSWSLQVHDAFGRPAKPGSYYFHRDIVENAPSCTLCIRLKNLGHWIVQDLVPDEGQPSQLSIDQYKTILMDFQSKIADPAVDSVEGHSAIELSQYRLEDYFSPEALKALQCFCTTSNGHPSDQEKWISFLLRAYNDGNDVPCDTFDNCLKTARWCREDRIPKMVHEYDLALHLLKKFDE